jgi:hypothetical protein
MASGALDPINNPQAWDTIQIGQQTSPGVAQVGEWKRAHEWDVKKGKGTLGGTVTFVGRPPAKGPIKFLLWTPTHFQAWDTFRPLLKFDPTKQAVQAVDIFHPVLADIDVTSVVTESIGNIVYEGQGLYSITVEFLEYFPPPRTSAVGTPTGSQSNVGTKPITNPGAPADPIGDAQQQQIAQLLNQAAQP